MAEPVKRLHKTGIQYAPVKRALDIAVAAVALVLLLLPMVLIGLAIYLDDPGSVIFAQYRIGRWGKRFLVYKFRTMRRNAPEYVATADFQNPEMYITRVGHFLRKTSLDELPQLLNVLLGDMSLVGPRPLIPQEQAVHQMREQFGVYSIRPGITGLAQINGRDMLSPDEKVAYDVAYLNHFGLWQDISIFMATLPGVFTGEGILEGPAIREKQR